MKKALYLLMLVFLITACEKYEQSATVVVTGEGPGFVDCPGETGEFCAAVYQPVCGDDGATYSNSCVACQNVKKYKEGECTN